MEIKTIILQHQTGPEQSVFSGISHIITGVQFSRIAISIRNYNYHNAEIPVGYLHIICLNFLLTSRVTGKTKP